MENIGSVLSFFMDKSIWKESGQSAFENASPAWLFIGSP
jgi:hypothetical protein